MKKFFLAVALLALLLLCSCASEADKANYNISKQADYFESERKITVYNAKIRSFWKQRAICPSQTTATMSWSVL